MPISDELEIKFVASLDEARSVKSVESFTKKATPLMEKAFNMPIDVSGLQKSLKDIKKNTKWVDSETSSMLFDAVSKSIKTRKKIGESPDLRLFTSKSQIKEEIVRLEKLKAEELAYQKQGGSLYNLSMIDNDISFLKKRQNRFSKQEKELSKSENNKKLTAFGRFFNRFKSYATVRLFRNLFSSIEQGFSKGIEGLIKFDNQANKTMSSISSSFDKINASVAIMAMPLLEIVEPIISSISDSIANFANNISMASANMKGLSTYTKISDEYMKDLRESANSTLLSFDKFESLNAQASPYEKAEITEEDKESAEKYEGIIKSVKKIVFAIWDVIKALGSAFLKIFDALEPYLDDIVRVLVWIIDIVADFIVGLAKIFGWLTSIIQTKESLGAILMLIGSIVTMLSLLSGNPIGMIKGILGGLTLFGAGAGITMFAGGGTPNKGTLFFAGESGAEYVTTMPNGQTGVTNIDQIEQAHLRALYSWWDEAKFDLPEGASFNLDGAQIARSKSFISEVNRRNSGLNLK